jgi:hypothetical protein
MDVTGSGPTARVATRPEPVGVTHPAAIPAVAARPDPVAVARPAGTPPAVTRPAAIPAAAGQPVIDLLTGPLRPAAVLAVHSAAVTLAVDTGCRTRVVTLLTVEASGVPNGLRTALHAADRPFAQLRAGDAAFVGAGRAELPGLKLTVVRTVRTAVPPVRPLPAAVTAIAAAAHDARRGLPDAPVDALREALAVGTASQVRRTVSALVGLGAGSTPGGDDVLCGTLAGLHATGRSGLVQQVSVAALDGLEQRTTLVSADLLRLAAAGHACAEATEGLVVAGRGPDPVLRRALARLLAVGHTSGADLATGLAVALAVPTRPLPRAPRNRPRIVIRAPSRTTDEEYTGP